MMSNGLYKIYEEEERKIMKNNKKNELINNYLNKYLSGYKSSEFYNELNSVVSELIQSLLPLLNNKEDIDLLFKYLPEIITVTQDESEETPLGHEHYYNIYVNNEEKLLTSLSIQEYLKDFIVENEIKSNELKYFYEYKPITENSPSHSNEGECLKAVFPFQNIKELKKLCNKTGLNYERVKNERCFHTEINDIPLFISLYLDPIKYDGRLEFIILDNENPYKITEYSLAAAKKADLIFREFFLP